MRVSIVRQADELHKETWDFALWTDNYADGITLNLIEHTSNIKPAKRHKWQRVDHWYRWETGKPYDQSIPDDVVAEAKRHIVTVIQAIKVNMG